MIMEQSWAAELAALAYASKHTSLLMSRDSANVCHRFQPMLLTVNVVRLTDMRGCRLGLPERINNGGLKCWATADTLIIGVNLWIWRIIDLRRLQIGKYLQQLEARCKYDTTCDCGTYPNHCKIRDEAPGGSERKS